MREAEKNRQDQSILHEQTVAKIEVDADATFNELNKRIAELTEQNREL
jgi:hypothetical protein